MLVQKGYTYMHTSLPLETTHNCEGGKPFNGVGMMRMEKGGGKSGGNRGIYPTDNLIWG